MFSQFSQDGIQAISSSYRHRQGLPKNSLGRACENCENVRAHLGLDARPPFSLLRRTGVPSLKHDARTRRTSKPPGSRKRKPALPPLAAIASSPASVITTSSVGLRLPRVSQMPACEPSRVELLAWLWRTAEL